MPSRRPRAAAQAAAASLRTPTPQVVEPSEDEEMVDVDVEASDGESGQDAATPARQSENPSETSTPAPTQSAGPRRRRLGRPPKNRPADWDDGDANDGSDAGTPKKKRGRPPGTGPGRWPKNRHLVPQTTQLTIDKAGTTVEVIDDEAVLPEDPEGEKKVDKNGYLKDGREYRCRTFTILDKGDKLYMLSTEPARCIGFRDSYLFFQKHPVLYKLVIDDRIKLDMISRDLMPHSYKGRTIGVCTARSVFREFGAEIIIGGRKIIDDYQVEAARQRGDVEGELAVPGDILPKEGEPYNKNQYVAWHGASAVYHTGGPSIPTAPGKVVEGKKRKVVVTDSNWMLEHAREASRFNSALAEARRKNMDGVYDPYTNLLHYPKSTQPTHARWEQVDGQLSTLSISQTEQKKISKKETINGDGHMTNGTNAVLEEKSGLGDQKITIFTPIASIYSRNYAIVDTQFETPQSSAFGIPGKGEDNYEYDVGTKGLSSISDDIIAELPPECLEPFLQAQAQEEEWKNSWGSEAVYGKRGALRRQL